MNKKLIIALISLLVSTNIFSQVMVEPKINIALAAVAIANPAIEFSVSQRSAVQLEFFGSFHPRNFLGSGNPFIATVGYAEYHYYIRDNFKGFYFGGTMGCGNWKMNRSQILVGYGNPTGNYDLGYSLIMGLNLGYKFLIKERWGIDINLGGGWVHSLHESYNKHGILVNKMNGSDEFLPFKGGIYISYRLGGKKDNNKKTK